MQAINNIKVFIFPIFILVVWLLISCEDKRKNEVKRHQVNGVSDGLVSIYKDPKTVEDSYPELSLSEQSYSNSEDEQHSLKIIIEEHPGDYVKYNICNDKDECFTEEKNFSLNSHIEHTPPAGPIQVTAQLCITQEVEDICGPKATKEFIQSENSEKKIQKLLIEIDKAEEAIFLTSKILQTKALAFLEKTDINSDSKQNQAFIKLLADFAKIEPHFMANMIKSQRIAPIEDKIKDSFKPKNTSIDDDSIKLLAVFTLGNIDVINSLVGIREEASLALADGGGRKTGRVLRNANKAIDKGEKLLKRIGPGIKRDYEAAQSAFDLQMQRLDLTQEILLDNSFSDVNPDAVEKIVRQAQLEALPQAPTGMPKQRKSLFSPTPKTKGFSDPGSLISDIKRAKALAAKRRRLPVSSLAKTSREELESLRKTTEQIKVIRRKLTTTNSGDIDFNGKKRSRSWVEEGLARMETKAKNLEQRLARRQELSKRSSSLFERVSHASEIRRSTGTVVRANTELQAARQELLMSKKLLDVAKRKKPGAIEEVEERIKSNEKIVRQKKQAFDDAIERQRSQVAESQRKYGGSEGGGPKPSPEERTNFEEPRSKGGLTWKHAAGAAIGAVSVAAIGAVIGGFLSNQDEGLAEEKNTMKDFVLNAKEEIVYITSSNILKFALLVTLSKELKK